MYTQVKLYVNMLFLLYKYLNLMKNLKLLEIFQKMIQLGIHHQK